MRFYSPSCGACKKFAPSFESAASKGSSNFTFARMAPGTWMERKVVVLVGPVGWNWGACFLIGGVLGKRVEGNDDDDDDEAWQVTTGRLRLWTWMPLLSISPLAAPSNHHGSSDNDGFGDRQLIYWRIFPEWRDGCFCQREQLYEGWSGGKTTSTLRLFLDSFHFQESLGWPDPPKHLLETSHCNCWMNWECFVCSSVSLCVRVPIWSQVCIPENAPALGLLHRRRWKVV